MCEFPDVKFVCCMYATVIITVHLLIPLIWFTVDYKNTVYYMHPWIHHIHPTELDKIQMAIAILCNKMNRNSIMMQSLIGIELFAGGAKDKLQDDLNSFGISCSASKLSEVTKYWAENRNPNDEIDFSKKIKGVI